MIQKSQPNAVSICTPNELHYEQIIKLLDDNIPVFCEKPMFWQSSDNYKVFLNKLKVIRNHPNRAVFVNNSSAYYIREIQHQLNLPQKINSFNFTFITNGSNTFSEIAVDLLPHGLAMLIELMGTHEITEYKCECLKKTYICSFYYSGCKVNFSFKEDAKYQKEFEFSINSERYIRVQNQGLSNYKVKLQCIRQNKEIKIEDPFEVYASKFVDFCLGRSNHLKDDFNSASHNLTLMAEILLTN